MTPDAMFALGILGATAVIVVAVKIFIWKLEKS
jgi:hypothetical protein